MSELIQLHDLSFKPFISEREIRKRVEEIGLQIANKYRDQNPIFLGVLNGAFIFAADLIRACNINCDISFIKLSSYRGTRSTGEVATLIGLDIDVKNRPVIIVEDIIDSGKTLDTFLPELQKLHPASVELAGLLTKPEALEYPVEIHYVGFEIPNKFVVGYGLDYNGLGRNIRDIYQLSE